MSFYPYAAPPPSQWTPPLPSSRSPAPIYTMLITGMVLFMASNVMPNLLPAPERIFNVAPRVLVWGFWLILLTLLANMTGTIPGIPQLHLTYVHMTVAALIFVLMWNQLANEIPPAPPAKSSSSSSSSSSREKPKEAKPEKKEDKPAARLSPWDDLRAHPSAFLTTRLNRAAMWPFPMGKAAKIGPELWWESGIPSHVGHFNKPESTPEAKDEKKKKSEDSDKEKEEEKEKAKEKEKLKQAEVAKLAEKEAAEKKKKKEEEMKKMMEAKKAAEAGGGSKVDSGAKKAEKDAEEKQKQKLWRTKALMMIVGISLLSKSLGFLLLLFFSLQMISQELNGPTPPSSSSQSNASSSSSSNSGSSTRPPEPKSDREVEKAKMAKMQAMKDAEREKVSASASGSGSSSSSRDREKAKAEASGKPSSTSSSSSSREKSSSSSSKDKSDLVTGDAVREASGSKTKTNIDGGEGGEGPTPAFLGMGMHYIHTRGFDGQLDDTGSANIPSEGMPHPLMTSFMRGFAG